MKKVQSVVAILLFTMSASNIVAAPITRNSNGYDWNKASRAERADYADRIVNYMSASYPHSALTACINETYRTNETYILKETVTSIATLCHMMLKG
ncbi:MAG: hypothetical protein Q4G28_07655 [Neisseria sp.]|nr:hypothetical protein [Neisseria sp.]